MTPELAVPLVVLGCYLAVSLGLAVKVAVRNPEHVWISAATVITLQWILAGPALVLLDNWVWTMWGLRISQRLPLSETVFFAYLGAIIINVACTWSLLVLISLKASSQRKGWAIPVDGDTILPAPGERRGVSPPC